MGNGVDAKLSAPPICGTLYSKMEQSSCMLHLTDYNWLFVTH
jgi:hypothetical protein